MSDEVKEEGKQVKEREELECGKRFPLFTFSDGAASNICRSWKRSKIVVIVDSRLKRRRKRKEKIKDLLVWLYQRASVEKEKTI